MSNSTLISYTKLSPNHESRQGRKISKITIHHMAGNLTIESCAAMFAQASRQASANYLVGTDGRIALCVDEQYRAWTSGNYDNDSIAVTIEVANDGGAPDWHVSDTALEATIKLCVDICQRNGIEALNFTGDAKGNLTQHNYFKATACPGPYLKSKFQYIADEVNKRLNASKELYRIRLTWEDTKSQIGAYKNKDSAINIAKENPGYSVYDSNGNCVYDGKIVEKEPEELYRIRLTWDNAKSQIGAYKNKDSAINIAKENPGYSVYDSKGTCVYDGTIKEEPVVEELYRIRKTWADSKSQIGAYKNKDSAIAIAKENSGYSVFDSKGNCVYDGTVKVQETPKVEETKPETKEETETTPEVVVVAVYDLDYPEKTLIVDRSINRTDKDCVKAIKKILTNNKDFDVNIAKAFFSIAPAYNIDPMMAIAQSCLETGWFKYVGSAVKPEHHNYCGLGVTSNGITGGIFDTIEQGVNAQLQHLFAYGCKDALLDYEIVDPRFKYVTRGIAPYWQQLAGRWAVPGYDKNAYATPEAAMNAGNTYGQKIRAIYNQLLATTVSDADVETYFAKDVPAVETKPEEPEVNTPEINTPEVTEPEKPVDTQETPKPQEPEDTKETETTQKTPDTSEEPVNEDKIYNVSRNKVLEILSNIFNKLVQFILNLLEKGE